MGGVYKFEEIEVKFPFQAYETQKDMMSEVISTLNGRHNALLESPTGTGKTMAILCSVLAWRAKKYPQGDGPKVFYSSRTHSQIQQVVEEYMKCGYKAKIDTLASKKYYCINTAVSNTEDIEQSCRSLINVTGQSRCSYYPKTDKLVNVLKTMNLSLEETKAIGNDFGGCPYFATQQLAQHADLIFLPYSYIFNEGRLEKLLQGSIIVFDEAHNIESYARDSASFDFKQETLIDLSNQLKAMTNQAAFKPMIDIIEGLKRFINDNKASVIQRDESHPYYINWWTGNSAVVQLEHYGISEETFQSAREALQTETKTGEPFLSAKTAFQLAGLLNTLRYFFKSEDKKEFYLCLQYLISTAKYSLSLMCMKPSIVFKDLVSNAFSIILTSGTLSPMTTFSDELGIQFEIKFEAKHAIENIRKQVWAGAIYKGANNQTLDGSFRKKKLQSYQDEIGSTLQKICQVVPCGTLVFFPSYQFMELLCNRWKETRMWAQLGQVFTEPKGTEVEHVSATLQQYFDASRSGKATFLAVCRGKVDEGVNFSGDNARAVIMVGIPYLNTMDIKVYLKKHYNNKDRDLCNGDEWYRVQAFRAVNQAVGRCIRHSKDFGALIFLDARYSDLLEEEEAVSKWLRPSIEPYQNLDTALESLANFFREESSVIDEEVFNDIWVRQMVEPEAWGEDPPSI